MGQVLELLRELNTEEHTKQTLAYYTNLARVSTVDDIGIGWLLWWYQRNLSIFKNILDKIEESDRVLLLIGATHKGILEKFLRDSGKVTLVDALDFLA